MSSTSGISFYPCDRGMASNVTSRGLHDFRATEHGTVCRYCGRTAPAAPVEPSAVEVEVRRRLDEYKRTFGTGDGRFIGDLLWNDIDAALAARNVSPEATT